MAEGGWYDPTDPIDPDGVGAGNDDDDTTTSVPPEITSASSWEARHMKQLEARAKVLRDADDKAEIPPAPK